MIEITRLACKVEGILKCEPSVERLTEEIKGNDRSLVISFPILIRTREIHADSKGRTPSFIKRNLG